MIHGIGIDQIEVKRVAHRIAKEAFKNKVFTAKEKTYCENQGIPAQHYAARFAGKEAFFKALGTGWSGKMEFFEIEILNNDEGKPYIQTYGATKMKVLEYKITHMHISLSHLESIATAMVILEKNSDIV